MPKASLTTRPSGPGRGNDPGSSSFKSVVAICFTQCLPIAASLPQLNRRTIDSAERAEHTAIASIRSKYLSTTHTVIKELAGIRRHALTRLVSAMRACDNREFIYVCHAYSSLVGSITSAMERALVRLKDKCHDGTLHDCPVIDELMN